MRVPMIPMSGKIIKKIPKLIIGKKDTLRKISYNGYFLIVTKSLYFKNRDITADQVLDILNIGKVTSTYLYKSVWSLGLVGSEKNTDRGPDTFGYRAKFARIYPICSDICIL
jgi:hypothetical protein